MKIFVIILSISAFLAISCEKKQDKIDNYHSGQLEFKQADDSYEHEDELIAFYKRRGNSSFQSKDYKSAIDAFNIILSKDSSQLDVLFKKSLADIASGDYENAIIELTSLIDKKNNEGKLYYFRGVAYYMLNLDIQSSEDWQIAKNLGYQFKNF